MHPTPTRRERRRVGGHGAAGRTDLAGRHRARPVRLRHGRRWNDLSFTSVPPAPVRSIGEAPTTEGHPTPFETPSHRRAFGDAVASGCEQATRGRARVARRTPMADRAGTKKASLLGVVAALPDVNVPAPQGLKLPQSAHAHADELSPMKMESRRQRDSG
jgi:hypothetical protein